MDRTPKFYIVDLRPKWLAENYITVWRPDNAGYAWPLIWAGKYDRATVDGDAEYYLQRDGRSLIRFPVPCEVADALGVAPASGDIDRDVGPVLPNNAATRAALRKAAYLPAKQEAA